MMPGMEVIILACDFEVRLRGVISEQVKPMPEAEGELFLAHQMRYDVCHGARTT